MSVKITVSQALSDSSGNRVAEVQCGTVADCLDQLVKSSPKFQQLLFDGKGQLHEYIDVFINRESAFPGPLQRQVNDGDELHILCLIGGG